MFFDNGPGDVFKKLFDGRGPLAVPFHHVIKRPQEFAVEYRVKLHVLVIVLPENLFLVPKVFLNMVAEMDQDIPVRRTTGILYCEMRRKPVCDPEQFTVITIDIRLPRAITFLPGDCYRQNMRIGGETGVSIHAPAKGATPAIMYFA